MRGILIGALMGALEGDVEPDAADLVALDAATGAPATMGAARIIGQANVAHEWGTDAHDDVISWDTGAFARDGDDPGDPVVARNSVLVHAPVHTWITVATCDDVSIQGTTNAWVEYDAALLQDPLYRFRLDQAW
jgi:hypothetical protein